MESVFKYIIGLGAAVMMPVIFTILGVCIRIRFAKAFKSGLLVGVGFVGLSVITALLTSSLGPALSKMVDIYGLKLGIFDMGWPSAAAVAYNTSVGALIIPVCLGVNLLMLLTKTTRTVNIDLWNRSEEHTSELQSRQYLVCRLLLEKKKQNIRSLC